MRPADENVGTGTDVQTPAHAILATLTAQQRAALKTLRMPQSVWDGHRLMPAIKTLYTAGLIRLKPINGVTAMASLTGTGSDVARLISD